jgi:dipeptidyl aminopeptidase/acylaminoacyl peptidase
MSGPASAPEGRSAPEGGSPRRAHRIPPRRLVESQVAIEEHRLSPDSELVVYVRRIVERGEYRRHLWAAPYAGGTPRRLTHGRFLDHDPQISPDGSVAFLRSSADLQASDEARTDQAWLVSANGGDPRPLPKFPHGVRTLRWSPDGRRLAIVADAPEPRFLVGPERPGQAPTARRLTRLDFRDDTGYLDRRGHLWLVEPTADAKPRRLTRGEFDVQFPAWSPGGRTIAFVADMGTDAAVMPQTAIYAVPARGGQPRCVASLRGDLTAPAWSPNGQWLAAFGTDVADPPEATQPEVWLIEAATGTTRSLTADLDLPAGVWASSYLIRGEQPEGPAWLDDDALVALVTRRGRVIPYRIPISGAPKPMADPEQRVLARGLDAAAGRVTVSAQLDDLPHEIYAVDGGRLQPLTRNGSAWWRRLPPYEVQELAIDAPSGTIQAWLVSPRGAAHRPMPTLLDIHGGPTGSWSPGASLDLVALTDAGYRVVRPNIRGSAGFGRDWVDGLGARWGEADAEDALAVIDWLVAHRYADEDRLGVFGLSYGGFLTEWLLGVTDRFRAAVAENGVTNQVTAWAECYFGVYDTRRTGLGDALSEHGVERLWARSPLRNVGRIRTPLLMLQAEDDRICPASDNVQLFAALRALGREVEYVLYPEEHHGMQMIGRPDRRIDRLERILAWFGRYLR